ncbi:MAG: sensor histidine kinase [Actinomycetota bacterium]|nr:sensor histidine kinase [Actinomycetota bacterium]
MRGKVSAEADGQAADGAAWLFPTIGAVIATTAVALPRLLSWPVAPFRPLAGLTALPLPIVGMMLTVKRRGGLVGWLLLAAGVGQFVNGALFPDVHHVSPHNLTAGWLGVVGGFFGSQSFVALAVVVVLFPDGRLPGRKWRPLMAAAGVAAVMFPLVMAIPWNASNILYPLDNPIGVEALVPLRGLFQVAMLLLAVVVVGGLSALVVRWRRGDPTERAQLGWVLWAVGVSAVMSSGAAVILAFSYQTWLDELIPIPWSLLVPLAIGVGVSRFRLYDIDVVVSRSLTYGALIVALASVYAATVAAAGALLAGALPSVAAAVLVAVCLAPLRDRLQRGANRLVYGKRDEPYQALASLALRLEGQIPPAQVVDAVVQGVATALRLPYVALSVPRPGQAALLAAKGQPDGEVFEVALVHRGETVGRLSVCAARGQRLRGREQRLLRDLARHAAAVIAAARLAVELEESRDRLAAVREQERRRIWSELHDGLGPLLTGVSFGLEAARNQVQGHPPAAHLLGELGGQVRDAIGDVRRMVQELRPPVLAEHGLGVAIDCQAAALADAAGFEVEVRSSGSFDILPAPLELAAYRIATEAVTNAARHAKPKHVSVRIDATDDTLTIEVSDDGIGLPDGHRPGGGLATMHQRAIELGGTCTITGDPRGGTVVAVTLPRDGRDS